MYDQKFMDDTVRKLTWKHIEKTREWRVTR